MSRNSAAALLDRVKQLHPRVIDLSLDRVTRLLTRLGEPQRRLPPTIHVAGTNGKGSTVAFLRAFLEAAGRRVHVYTSPHLIRFNERIVVAGETIDDAGLAARLAECERANGGEPITFFEITTAAAFLAFAETAADALLLETGLGGRLDATNVVERPAVTVLTPISLDHQAYLGDTLEAIAFEKAGILKLGVPCTVGRQPDVVRDTVRARAKHMQAPLIEQGEQWVVEAVTGGMVYRDANASLTLPVPALPGEHQIQNAGLAVATFGVFEGRSPATLRGSIAKGLHCVHWPGRLQRLTAGALLQLLPAGWQLWADGGHNPAAGEALAKQAAAWSDRPLDLVFGMLRQKDAIGFLSPLLPLVRRVVTVAIADEDATLSAEESGEIVRAAGGQAMVASDVPNALRTLAAQAEIERPARVLVTGSLYLIGQVLASQQPAEAVPG